MAPAPRLADLTYRQLTVLRLVCKGLRNSEIASHIGLAERTVKTYVKDLFLIFDVTNRTELAGLLAAEAEGDSFEGRPRSAVAAAGGAS
jgi:DNA-binding NarL/FixJ family response regulator